MKYSRGSSDPNKENGKASRNIKVDEIKNPTHQAPTHRGSAGVIPHLKAKHNCKKLNLGKTGHCNNFLIVCSPKKQPRLNSFKHLTSAK